MAFDFDAEKYRKASTRQKEWGAKLIWELNLVGNEKILDLGCGEGSMAAQLAKLVPDGDVIGIDASQSMIDLAEKTYKAQNLRFNLMDINEIVFKNQFDVVISNATLHWIMDHSRLLWNVYKALKADGIVRFNFAGDGNCSALNKVVPEIMAEKKYAGYFNNFDWPWFMPTLGEYEKLLEASSFKEAKVWGENADRFFRDKDTMIGWIDQPCLVPFLKYIDGPDKNAFRDTVVDRMVKETILDDGRYFETFRRINVFAKK
ncbi:MAG: methyltransferase domain-containing protein [Planctomycetes bacterium]|nr:methyltransferase domain-containing protein [Planctomycetota bacterium]